MRYALKRYPLRDQTPREANAMVEIAGAVKEFWSQQLTAKREEQQDAQAQLDTFQAQHGARLGELNHFFSHTPSADLRKLQAEEPQEFEARNAEWKTLSDQEEPLAERVADIRYNLDPGNWEGDMECDFIDAGHAHGSREGFRLGLMYALSLTPDKALAAVKAMAADEAADTLIYGLLADRDKGGPFSVEVVEPKGGDR